MPSAGSSLRRKDNVTLPVYLRLVDACHTEARNFLVNNLAPPDCKGSWEGWSPDPGRLEDGLAEMLSTQPALMLKGEGILSGEFQPSDLGCSHGLSGICGRLFCGALNRDGRTLMVEIHYRGEPDRLIITRFRFSLE